MLKGLYPIVNVRAAELKALDRTKLETYVRALASAQVPLIQLRAKALARDACVQLGMSMLPWLGRTQLVINDDPDAARACGAHWVHVGQGDMSLKELRIRFPHLSVGISTHSRAQLASALAEAPDYVAFGPIFATQSKENAEPALGLTELRAAASLAQEHKVPLVAIGGIDLSNIDDVAPHASLVSVISVLERAVDPAHTAAALHARVRV